MLISLLKKLNDISKTWREQTSRTAESVEMSMNEHSGDFTKISELREAAGMTQTEFANYFGIPYRTVQKWDTGIRQCTEYLLRLLEYKLRNEGLI